MYHFGRPQPAGQYGRIDLAGRIQSADPHALVAILFDELLGAIARVRRAVEAGRAAPALERALDVIQALRMTLDHDRGGAIAGSLAAVYEEALRQLLLGVRERDTLRVDTALEMIAEIADAWTQIAPRAA